MKIWYKDEANLDFGIIQSFTMPAVNLFFTVILVAGCGQLVSSTPFGGQIVQPGPNTYTIGEGTKTQVEVRRVPASQSARIYETATTPSESTPTESITFGVLTPHSQLSI